MSEINSNEKEENNIIIAYITVGSNNSKKRIINSYENAKREDSYYFKSIDNKESLGNEDQIKNCEIFINDTKINFSYFYTFPHIGKYKIKYKFNQLFHSTIYMFSKCDSLESIDLSKFNKEKVTEMRNMFYNCKSLTSINLSNFKTGQVTDMNNMFSECPSLTSLDLSSFNTNKVVDIGGMFSLCSSLISVDLSSFTTENVVDMRNLFYCCHP